jgi:cell division protein FtsQ
MSMTVSKTVKLRGARKVQEKPRRPLAERLSRAAPLVLAAVIICFVISGVIYLPRVMDAYPIESVKVEGVKDQRRQQEVRKALAELVSGENFFSVPLRQIYARAASISWVDGVEIRREWPNRLELRITERVPVAVWNESALVSSSGQPFKGIGKYSVEALPALFGPQDRLSAVMDYYHSMSKLLAPSGLVIRRIAVDARLTARLELNDGMRVVVDREQYARKLRRFSRLYETTLSSDSRDVASADLRYSDGIAIAWRDAAASES